LPNWVNTARAAGQLGHRPEPIDLGYRLHCKCFRNFHEETSVG